MGSGEESKCFEKRYRVSSSGPTPSSCRIHGPIHPVVLYQPWHQNLQAQKAPILQMKNYRDLGWGRDPVQVESDSECLSGQAFPLCSSH